MRRLLLSYQDSIEQCFPTLAVSFHSRSFLLGMQPMCMFAFNFSSMLLSFTVAADNPFAILNYHVSLLPANFLSYFKPRQRTRNSIAKVRGFLSEESFVFVCRVEFGSTLIADAGLNEYGCTRLPIAWITPLLYCSNFAETRWRYLPRTHSLKFSSEKSWYWLVYNFHPTWHSCNIYMYVLLVSYKYPLSKASFTTFTRAKHAIYAST